MIDIKIIFLIILSSPTPPHPLQNIFPEIESSDVKKTTITKYQNKSRVNIEAERSVEKQCELISYVGNHMTISNNLEVEMAFLLVVVRTSESSYLNYCDIC